MDWRFNKERTRVVLDEPQKRPLKLTATRLGSALGLNPWKSPFATWCEICRVYKEPFTENKYTKAGNAIEPILIDWAKKQFGNEVKSPAEFYGNVWPEVKRQYDFYKGQNKVFGGMWDAKIVNSNNETVAVIEIKTTGRAQDWGDGVPDEKLVQALQYGHLEGAKRTFVIGAFLTDEDYMHPDRFVPIDGENVRLYTFDTETATVMFDGEPTTISELMAYAEQWWESYVETGISPEIDYKADETIIKTLKTEKPDEDEDTSLGSMIALLDAKEAELASIREKHGLDALETEINALKDALKRILSEGMAEDSTKVEVGNWTLTKSERSSVDTSALKKDGLYEKYEKKSVTYTLRKKGEK